MYIVFRQKKDGRHSAMVHFSINVHKLKSPENTSSINYNATIDHLMETIASFLTFLSHHLRPYVIVIINLHHSSLQCTNISAALLEKGCFIECESHYVKNKNKGLYALSVFFVDLNP